MELVKFHTSYNLAEMAVMKSVLDAAGIFNFIKTYEHGAVNPLILIALGGQSIYIRAEDMERAKDFISSRPEISDFDPVPDRKFGNWKRATFFGLCFNIFIFLPLFFLRPTWLLLLAGISALTGVIFWVIDKAETGIALLILSSFVAFFALLLLHAEKLALPNIRRQKNGA